MRAKDEIGREYASSVDGRSEARVKKIEMEVLLDIRELLQELLKKEQKGQ